MGPILSCGPRAPATRRDLAQVDAGVMLERLDHRAVGLAQRALGCGGRLRQGAAERLDHELVRLRVERERRGLTRRADDAAGGAREADEVLALPARRARRELR